MQLDNSHVFFTLSSAVLEVLFVFAFVFDFVIFFDEKVVSQR